MKYILTLFLFCVILWSAGCGEKICTKVTLSEAAIKSLARDKVVFRCQRCCDAAIPTGLWAGFPIEHQICQQECTTNFNTCVEVSCFGK
jgi:hypothetical protein